MLHNLIDHNADLRRLQVEGYSLKIVDGYLAIYNIPYVNVKKEVCSNGVLVSTLEINGKQVLKPNTHVVYFAGQEPHDQEGKIISSIIHSKSNIVLSDGVTTTLSFSNKPSAGYSDYYEKMTNYIRIISAPAMTLDSSVTPRKNIIIESECESVFNYEDTNSSRACITNMSANLKSQKIGIIGVGGTGSYVMDFIAKTPVQEIHIFDGDEFLQHNAFRCPGAPSLLELEEKQYKVFYLSKIYSRMHKKVIAHEQFLNDENLSLLENLNFVFLCIDTGSIKKIIVDFLMSKEISFVDVGMGLYDENNKIGGIVRTTISTENNRDTFFNRVSIVDSDEEDVYTTNIQIAELNALNAALAVIKWKKLSNYYHDLTSEFHSTYTISTGQLLNEEN